MFRAIIGFVYCSHLPNAFMLPYVVEVFVEWGGRQSGSYFEERKMYFLHVQVCIIEKLCCTGFYTISHDLVLLTMWLLFWINSSISLNVGENMCMISGFRHEVDENCFLLGHYAASNSNSLPTYLDNLSVPSSKVKNPIGCPEMSVRNYCYLLHNNPEECSS
jgi:hypothetical protein